MLRECSANFTPPHPSTSYHPLGWPYGRRVPSRMVLSPLVGKFRTTFGTIWHLVDWNGVVIFSVCFCWSVFWMTFHAPRMPADLLPCSGNACSSTKQTLETSPTYRGGTEGLGPKGTQRDPMGDPRGTKAQVGLRSGAKGAFSALVGGMCPWGPKPFRVEIEMV